MVASPAAPIRRLRRSLGVSVTLLLLAAAPSATPAGAQETSQTSPPNPAVVRMLDDVRVLARSPREAGTAAELAAADHVAMTLRGLGLAPTTTDVRLVNGRTSRNVAASFGTGPVEILLGAHLDTLRVSPGADDNASGVAVLLEYARHLDGGGIPIPAGTTITLVWFGAEEVLAGQAGDIHHAGSRQLAAARAAAGQQPHWMLSVDMVGVGATPIAVLFEGTDASAARLLSAAGGGAVTPRGDISDHEAFARRGTPSALLWRPDNPDYHGPGDTSVSGDRLLHAFETVRNFVAAAASPLASGRGMAHELMVDLLARRPDIGGAGTNGGRLDRGQTSPGAVGATFLTSPEWAGVVAPVARVYLAAFGRQADLGGLTHWTGLVRSGAGLDGVAGAFFASPEFAARNGAPDSTGFVRLLYRNVLGRDADAGGQAHWVGQLDSGRMTRAQVLVQFSESPEHKARTAAALPVALAYEGLLRRPVDPGGLAFWSGRPLAELVNGLVGSTEFRNRFG